MQLYYVRADSKDGDNFDLYVNAKTVAQAIKLWRAYWKHLQNWCPKDAMWVDEVPTTKMDIVGAVEWIDVKRHELVNA
jgi:hypothetical protein